MEFLVASLSPALSRVVEASLLTGFATAHWLETARKAARVRGPQLPLRQQRSLARTASGATPTAAAAGAAVSGAQLARANSRAKSLANDPQRQGNIWHRYEQLEHATNTLTSVNQQLVEERTTHKRIKRELQDAIEELQRQNAELRAGAAAPRDGAMPATSMSQESLAVLRGIESGASGQDELLLELGEAKAEVQRLTEEVSDAHNKLEFLREEKEALAADNAKLQRQPAGGRRRSGMGSAGGGDPLGAFAGEVASVAAARRGEAAPEVTREGTPKLASFGSDIETQLRQEEAAAAAAAEAAKSPTQLAALQAEVQLLKERLAKAESGAAGGGGEAGSFVRGGGGGGAGALQEQNRRLQEENQRLQNKVLRLDIDPARSADQEAKYNRLLEENTRLQSKVVRLNLGGPGAGGADAAQLQELRDENAELRDDNDKLVAYLESLERRKRELEALAEAQAAGGGGDPAQLGQLQADNRKLAGEVARLRKRLDDQKLSSTGSFTTVPIPVHVETGEEMDRDLWMLVEELRDQNRSLIEKLQAARAGQAAPVTPSARPRPPVAGGARSAAAAAASASGPPPAGSSGEVNADNIRLVNHLSDENATLQVELLRLTQKLADGAPPAEGEVLQEAIAGSERLLAEKQQIHDACQRLAERNTRLTAENEALQRQLRGGAEALPRAPIAPAAAAVAGEQPSRAAAAAAADSGLQKQESRGIFGTLRKGFRRSKSRNSGDMRPEPDEESQSVASGEHSESGRADAGRKDSPGASRQLVAELIEENTKLFEENKRLGASTASIQELAEARQGLLEENLRLQAGMGLVKDLTEENSALVEENSRLADSVNRCLEENRELSNRLIDLALNNEGDVFAAAFGDGQPTRGAPAAPAAAAVAAPGVDAAGMATRQAELTAQMRAAGEQHLARRVELSSRAADQLEAFHARGSRPSSAASPSPAGVHTLQRQSARSSETHRSSFTAADGATGSTSSTARRQLDSETSHWEQFPPGGAAAAPVPQQQQSPQERVKAAFFAHGPIDDLASFMRVLGFSGFEQPSGPGDEGALLDVFQRAVDAAADMQSDPSKTAEQKAVAVEAGKCLQDWYALYTSG